MWLADWIAAGAGEQIPTSTIVAAVIALVSSAIAAWLGSRGVLRSADAQREADFDRRIDERLTAAETRLDAMTAERDRYREMYHLLRLAVIGKGLDPDDLQPEKPRAK